jgi:hypothetical protein
MNCFLRRVVPRTRGAAYRFGLARRVDGIILNDFESGEISPDFFCAACHMGLEGIVSKHKDRAYCKAVLASGKVIRSGHCGWLRLASSQPDLDPWSFGAAYISAGLVIGDDDRTIN